MHSKYLIVGSSHAALEAATAIRLIDADGALTLLTRDQEHVAVLLDAMASWGYEVERIK